MLERRNHWEKTSHSLLVASILHVLYAESDKTLHGVAALLSDPSHPFEATLRKMMLTLHLGDRPHPVVASGAREVLNKSDNERSGVLSTAMSFLGLYRDPIVAAVTRRCDWRIADLMEAEHPVSLYLVVPPSDISRTKPLIRLILNQIGRRLTESLEPERRGVEGSKDHARRAVSRRRLLMMLDEFPALGRLDFFEQALAFMAGYGLRAILIAQSLNQIEKAYGPNNSILDNCHVRIAFSTNDERTAKRISDALGTATELRAQRNYAGHRLSPWLGHLMVSRQETARPLLTPGEVMQFSPEEEIVMVSGHPPVRASKLRYFEDRNFTARLFPPPPLPPPSLSPGAAAYPDRPQPRADDWTGLPFPVAPPGSAHPLAGAQVPGDGGGISQAAALEALLSDPVPTTDDRTHERDRLSEFDDEDMDSSRDEHSPRQVTARQFTRTARLAALDPNDGIPL
jgi:type IV secretion system protein VirD4